MDSGFPVIVTAALSENIILGQMIGADPALRYATHLKKALVNALLMLLILPPMVTIGAWIIPGHGIQQNTVLLLVLWCLLLGRFVGSLSRAKPEWLLLNQSPLFLINATILGALLVARPQITIGHTISLAFGIALGFSVVLLLLAGLRAHLALLPAPHALQGAPLYLITLAILSMALTLL